MNITDVFTSFIATDYLDLDNTELETFCKNQIYNSQNYKVHNETQSGFIDIASPELGKLISLVENRTNSIHIQSGLSFNYRQSVNQVWATLNNAPATSQPHQHTKAMFSCVYYVKGDHTSGRIRFMNPVVSACHFIGEQHIEQYNKFTSNEYSFYPEPGKLLIFPSWLYHYVEHNSGSERISIALDTVFLEV